MTRFLLTRLLCVVTAIFIILISVVGFQGITEDVRLHGWRYDRTVIIGSSSYFGEIDNYVGSVAMGIITMTGLIILGLVHVINKLLKEKMNIMVGADQ